MVQIGRPAPAGLPAGQPDRRLPDLDDLARSRREVPLLIRRRERLELEARHRPEDTPCASSGACRILPSSIDRTLDRSRSEGAYFRVPGLSRLDRPTGVSGSMRVVPGDDGTASPGQLARARQRVCRSAPLPKSRASCRSSTSSARRSPSRRRAPPTRDCARSTVRRRRRSSSPRCARRWHCFGCGHGRRHLQLRDGARRRRRSPRRCARSPRRPASRSMSGPSARTPAGRASARSSIRAIAFYHAVLTGSKAGEPALDYLHGRGFTDETIETFQLGWAPGGWDQMAAPAPGEARRPPRGARRGRARQPAASAAAASSTSSAPGSCSRSATQNGHAVGLGGRLLGRGGAQVPQLPGDAAVRQEPHAVPHRQGQGPDPQGRPGGHRRGLHRRPDGPPGRLRQRRRQPRHGADAGPGRAADALREPDRARLRRRPGRREGRARSASPALAALIGAAPGRRLGRQARGRARRAAARRQGSRRGRPRGARRPGRRPIAAAKPLVEYLIGHHAGRFDLKTSAGRIGFVEAVMPSIRDIEDPLRRDEALQEVRRVSGVEERVLRQVLERRIAGGRARSRRRPARRRITADAVLASPDALPVDDILRAVTPVESELLRLLLLVPDQQLRVADELGPGPAAEHARARAVSGDRPPAGAERPGRPPAVRWRGAAARGRRRNGVARPRVVRQVGPGPADARRRQLAYEVDTAAPRARGRPAARAQRLQRGRPGRGRTRRRRRRDRPFAARATPDQ